VPLNKLEIIKYCKRNLKDQAMLNNLVILAIESRKQPKLAFKKLSANFQKQGTEEEFKNQKTK
jgi:hypothetical protein